MRIRSPGSSRWPICEDQREGPWQILEPNHRPSRTVDELWRAEPKCWPLVAASAGREMEGSDEASR
jgi:hypothetical protein